MSWPGLAEQAGVQMQSAISEQSKSFLVPQKEAVGSHHPLYGLEAPWEQRCVSLL